MSETMNLRLIHRLLLTRLSSGKLACSECWTRAGRPWPREAKQ